MAKHKRDVAMFVIAHVNSAGTGVGTREILAKTEDEAKKEFKAMCPDREISVVGVKGVS